MRYPWATTLALIALLLSVLASLPTASRCVQQARVEAAAHACCPDRAEDPVAEAGACSGPCCEQPDLLAATQPDLPDEDGAALPDTVSTETPLWVARPRPGQRAVPPRGPPRRPPRAPTWLSHRALLI